MKKNSLLLFLACILLLCSCEKELYDTPEGRLSISSKIVRVGEPVTFEWIGSGDHIVFYSGELKHEYKFKYRKVLKGIPEVSFDYRNYKGANDPDAWERGIIEVYYSTDYVDNNFEIANWNKVTERFNINFEKAENTYLNTGYVPFEELQGTKTTFAFKAIYNGGSPVDIGWANFKVRSYSPEIESYVDVINISKDADGIKLINEENSLHKWQFSTNWRFMMPPSTTPTKQEEVGWCVMPTLSFEDTVYPGDEGEVKKTLNIEASPWTHVYSKPGKYSIAVIVSSYDGSKGVSNEKVIIDEIEVLDKID